MYLLPISVAAKRTKDLVFVYLFIEPKSSIEK